MKIHELKRLIADMAPRIQYAESHSKIALPSEEARCSSGRRQPVGSGPVVINCDDGGTVQVEVRERKGHLWADAISNRGDHLGAVVRARFIEKRTIIIRLDRQMNDGCHGSTDCGTVAALRAELGAVPSWTFSLEIPKKDTESPVVNYLLCSLSHSKPHIRKAAVVGLARLHQLYSSNETNWTLDGHFTSRCTVAEFPATVGAERV